MDIAIATVKVIEELTDEDVGEGVEDEDAFLAALDQLIGEMVGQVQLSSQSRLFPLSSHLTA